MTDQPALPVVVSIAEIERQKSLGAAITLCHTAAGYETKEVQAELKFDKGQFSRWASGDEGIVWPKLRRLMDFCGNYAPVVWMASDCNFDPNSLRRRESAIERENRLLREENAALRRVITGTASTT